MVDRIMLAGLLKIELPDHTVLLCDGGSLLFDGQRYSAEDTLFGVVEGCDAQTEGVGDEVPSFTVTFIPPDDVPASQLNSSAYQGSRLRMWIAEVIDDDTPLAGTIVGTPDSVADTIIDLPRLRFNDGRRLLEVDCISVWQRLLGRNEGNLLNGGFHKRQYPNERGLDNTTGVGTSVAWGAKTAPRGLSSGGGGGGGGSQYPSYMNSAL